MPSSVEVSSSRQRAIADDVSGDLRLVETVQARKATSRFRRAVLACEAAADLVTITITVVVSYVTYYSLALGKHLHYPLYTVLGLAFTLAAVMVLMLDRAGAYGRGNSLLRVRETEQVLRVSAQAFLIALAVSFLSSYLFSRWFLVLCLIMVPVVLFVQKSLVYQLVSALHAKGYGTERVLIYGAGFTGRRVFSALTRSPRLGLDPVAFVDDDSSRVGTTIYEMGYERRRSAPVAQGPLTTELLNRYEIDLVILAIPSVGREKFLRTMDQAFLANARISFVPSHFLPSDPQVDYQDVDGVLLASFGRSNRRAGYEFLKRIVDVVGSLLMLTLGSPLFLLLGILVKLDSPGPILFRQDRIGEAGKPFKMFKFRTMHADAPAYDFSPKASSDPRITGLGKFLRRTSLDELPQLLNVLHGTMSLVGPRPEMPFIVGQYNQRHKQRLQVKPGLTGLWQLSGDRGFLIHENIEYDLYYIQHRNFFMDLAVLLHTSIFAMRGI